MEFKWYVWHLFSTIIARYSVEQKKVERDRLKEREENCHRQAGRGKGEGEIESKTAAIVGKCNSEGAGFGIVTETQSWTTL